MSAPIAYLTRREGALVAEAPLMPCEVCDLSEICGPDYPCPKSDPIVEEEDMPEIHASTLQPRGEYLVPLVFDSLEDLVDYSRKHPRELVGCDDDPGHFYRNGVLEEHKKVS